MIDATGIQTIVERSAVFAGKNVIVTVIANPAAGGFKIRKYVKNNERWFAHALDTVKDQPVRATSCTVKVEQTREAGHEREIASEVFSRAVVDTNPDTLFLIVTAGGDGTSLEVQGEFARRVLEKGQDSLIEKVCLLRLPFGTGNDGSDGRTLEDSLTLLTGDARIAMQSAVIVRTSGVNAQKWYAFNIASIGLDAFVTHMTNQIKNKLPGNFYKIWLDIACLFYDWIYKIGLMRVSAVDANGTVVKHHEDSMLLYLMGASGHRTYGSNQLILPDDNNVCGIKNISLMRKLTLKKYLRTGGHASFPDTILYSAKKITIDYDERILVQLDGEGHLLEPSDFPLIMELSKPFIKILKRK